MKCIQDGAQEADYSILGTGEEGSSVPSCRKQTDGDILGGKVMGTGSTSAGRKCVVREVELSRGGINMAGNRIGGRETDWRGKEMMTGK